MSNSEAEAPAPPAWPRVLAALTCMVIGVLISAWPHILNAVREGDPAWIADHDDAFYLAVAGRAYESPWLRPGDPVAADGGASIYKPLPLLPGPAFARLFGLGPMGIGVAWRVWAGATIGLATYLVVGRFVRRNCLAAAVAMVLLADCGLVEGRPLLRTLDDAARVASGRAGALLAGKPLIHPEWRIATPGLTHAYLLLAVWLLARAWETPSRARLALAGIGFGLLFHVYVYSWTAFGLALVLGLALDAGHRRAYWYTGLIGGLVGLPSVVSDMLLKRSTSPDWLLRSDKFLPIGRFEELLIPRAATALIVGLVAWTWWRRRDLFPVALLAASALMLSNHQILTGLQIENFHWTYVWGPCLCLLVLVLVAERLPAGRATHATVFVLTTVFVATGVWLRGVEARRSGESRELVAGYRAYLAQRSASGRSAGRVAAAGDDEYMTLAAVLDGTMPLSNYMAVLSPSVDDAGLDERLALNALLLGRDRVGFEAEQTAALEANVWGPWAPFRSRDALNARLASRLAAFDALAVDLPAACDRYRVGLFARPALGGTTPPPGGSWTLLERGPRWDVWRRGSE